MNVNLSEKLSKATLKYIEIINVEEVDRYLYLKA